MWRERHVPMDSAEKNGQIGIKHAYTVSTVRDTLGTMRLSSFPASIDTNAHECEVPASHIHGQCTQATSIMLMIRNLR